MAHSLIRSFLLLFLLSNVRSQNIEDTLIRDLLRNYSPLVRPSLNYTDVINILFDVSIVQITNLDEKNQMMSINAWLTMTWMDNKLSWKPSNYEGVEEIRLPSSCVWKPDITLYNNVYVMASMSEISTQVIVFSNGTVTWLTATVYKSSCFINVKYFPFDQQNCSLIFASWAYDARVLDIQLINEIADTSNYIENNEWTLTAVQTQKHSVNYSCCADSYPDITYYIIIKRRPWFYIYTMVFPSILITTTGFFGILIPLDQEKKISTGLKSLLSKTLFLMVIPDTLPPNSDEGIPLIGAYYICSMLLILVGNFFTIMTYIFKKGLPAKSSIYPFKNFHTEYNKRILIDGDDTYVSVNKFKEIASTLKMTKENNQLKAKFLGDLNESSNKQQKIGKYYVSECL